MKTYKKVTIGFVIQDYTEDNNGDYVCISQNFVASDEQTYEDDLGTPLNIDTSKEKYQPFEMVQPTIDITA